MKIIMSKISPPKYKYIAKIIANIIIMPAIIPTISITIVLHILVKVYHTYIRMSRLDIYIKMWYHILWICRHWRVKPPAKWCSARGLCVRVTPYPPIIGDKKWL